MNCVKENNLAQILKRDIAIKIGCIEKIAYITYNAFIWDFLMCHVKTSYH